MERTAGVAALYAAYAEEFFAAAFQVCFYGLGAGLGHDDDHAYTEIEGVEEFVGFDFADPG